MTAATVQPPKICAINPLKAPASVTNANVRIPATRSRAHSRSNPTSNPSASASPSALKISGVDDTILRSYGTREKSTMFSCLLLRSG